MTDDRESFEDPQIAAHLYSAAPRLHDNVNRGWVNNSELLKQVVGEALAAADAPLWMTLYTNQDQFLTIADYRELFAKRKIVSGPWGDRLLFVVELGENLPQCTNLVRVMPQMLGFRESVARSVFMERAAGFGYFACPSRVALELRVHYVTQPIGETLYVASEPYDIGDGDLGIFGLSNHGTPDFKNGFWIDSHEGDPDAKYSLDSEWVFQLEA